MKIPVGKEFFDEIRRDHAYYVDKTELLYQLAEGTNNEVTLFTRPRCFGKTLMMSMIENFFSIQKGDSHDIFEGLDIMNHKEFCDEWMNQYPVLFVTLKGVEGLSFEETYKTLQVKMSDLCIKHQDLLNSQCVNQVDKETFQELMSQKATPAKVKGSLKTIMRMMAAHYGKPVILLIDEYDVPLAKASKRNTETYGFYRQMLDSIRGMFDAALKTNEFLKFAVITGCLRISKESFFTGTNNFMSYSVLDERFSSFFGFTQGEVDELLNKTGLTDKMEIMRDWYDGYIFGNTPVYCPWDVVSYVSTLLDIRTAKPKNYWKNTSSNGILLTFVKRSDIDIREKRKRRGMILEAKKSDKEEDMPKDALDGRQQIADKEYMRGFSGFESVMCYGISFFKKKALVKKLTI